MIKHILLLFILQTTLVTHATRHELTIGNEPLVYYTHFPDTHSFPILIILDGSYSADKGPESVQHFDSWLIPPFVQKDIGIMILERRGVDGPEQINHHIYHQYNTPSQRLSDHLLIIQRLQANPPTNWNQQLFIAGGSEGSLLAVKLADHVKADACIAMTGCGDQSMQALIWQHIQTIYHYHLQHAPWWKKLLSYMSHWYQSIPTTQEDYERHCQYMKDHPSPKHFWYGQSYRYWADALDQTEEEAFMRLRCSTLVVSGGRDIEYPSTVRLFDKHHPTHIEHLCLAEAGHDVLHPKYELLPTLINFLRQQITD